MKHLFLSAFKNRKHRPLIIFTIVAMCMLTIASQLEVLALGVITKKGPDFFELFAPKEEGVLQRVDRIDRDQVEVRFKEIAGSKDVVSKQDATHFLSHEKSSDRIQQVINVINGYFPISENLTNLAFVLVFVALFKAITLFGHRYATKMLAIRVSKDLRQDYFEHIQSLPMEFYQKYNIGSISSRVVGDTASIAEAITAVLVNYLQTPFTTSTSRSVLGRRVPARKLLPHITALLSKADREAKPAGLAL